MCNSSMRYMPFLLLIVIMQGACTTDMDYRLGNSKYSDSSITEEESFHGASSARISVDENGNYVRTIIYMNGPMPIEDLDSLSMWIDPVSGDGKVQIEIFLDGDGDASYDSDSSKDARLTTAEEPFSEIGLHPLQWNELDGMDLSYERYKDEDFGSKNLDECRKALGGRIVVKVYITVYKDPGVDKTVAYIDYVKIGDQVISFEPLEKEEIKKAPKSASPGSEITYTITYGNNFLEPLDLLVRESYDPRTVFVSADPMPDAGTNNVWTIHDLPPGKHGQIKVKVRSIRMDCKADINGRVSGRGYSASRGHLSTDLSSYTVTNTVAVSSDKFSLAASASTKIRPVEGSIIDFKEHGSGFYSCEERLSYSPSRIFVFRDTNASKSHFATNTSPALVNEIFGSDWYASLLCENRADDMMHSERYAEGRYLDLDSHAYLGKTSSYFETAASFSGRAEQTSRWGDIVYDERFAGEFTINSNSRMRSDRKTARTTDNGLECCPENVNE